MLVFTIVLKVYFILLKWSGFDENNCKILYITITLIKNHLITYDRFSDVLVERHNLR